jgi:pimeloyl-ACP methyl ester carboxylesterase
MSLHVTRAGNSGTPVLLLHGIGGAGTSFDPQLEALSRTHRVLAWDAPGYGAAPDPATAPGMAGYAAAAAEVLTAAGRAHVVGASWGGVIATRLAAEHPDLVHSLTLAGASRGSGRTRQAAAAMRARPGELAELGPTRFARRRAPNLLSPHADQALIDAVSATMARVRLPGYGYAAEAMAETDHTDLLARITAPTLVTAGAEDRVTGPAESHALATGIPGARLEIIPHAGHAANQERPEEFTHTLLEFLTHIETTLPSGAGS